MRRNGNQRARDGARKGDGGIRLFLIWTAVLCLSAICLLTACGRGQGGAADGTEGAPGDSAAGTSTGAPTAAGAATAADPTAASSGTGTDRAPDPPVTPSDYRVTERDGTADVDAPSGLSYRVSGYDGREEATFTFTKGLTFAFDQPELQKEFNRFSLTYTASEPLRVFVTYEQDGQAFRDAYFLEAGEHVFSGLSIGYAARKTARNLTGIEAEACRNRSATLLVSALTSELIEFYPDTYFLENERFKVGVDIQWGGAVNYIGDKAHQTEGLGNLINRADAGRLVQQSYYGTGAIPGVYEPGVFNHSKWNYNPVQGGDMHRHNGRLIDIEARGDSVYVKAQPQDWSLNNQITPSYAENTYTLTRDAIRVDNRFVDFSGWTHPFRHQELPAFYTVSYLNTFYWYDGSKPWTGAEVSFRDDLKFWGDPKYSAECRIPMKQSNDETWGAFVNQETDYGIGLYVPNIDVLYVGRYAFNNSPDPKSAACGYIAPLNALKLVSFEPLEYSYLIAAGSVGEIRSVFQANRDFAANEGLRRNYQSMRVPDQSFTMDRIDFSDPGAMGVLSGLSCTDMAYDEAEGAVRLSLTGEDPYVNLDFASGGRPYAAEDYGRMRITYMIPADLPANQYSMDVFLSVGETSLARTRYRTQADGQYHTLEIDLTRLSYWQGTIGAVRLDYFADMVDGGTLYLKSFQLVP